jgi:hypothetical protein
MCGLHHRRAANRFVSVVVCDGLASLADSGGLRLRRALPHPSPDHPWWVAEGGRMGIINGRLGEVRPTDGHE